MRLDSPPRGDLIRTFVASLMPIGRFARSVRLSIKALRRYDEEGLLTPAFVDPNTGYRYYRPDQARLAMAIGLLRKLDLPLADIREVVGGPGRHQVLRAHRQRLERTLVETQAALDSVDRILAEEDLFPYPVTVVSVGPTRCATLRLSTTPEKLERDTTEAVHRLMTELSAEDLQPGDPVQSLFEEPLPSGEQSLTVAVALPAGAPRNPGQPPIELRTLPGGTFAQVEHLGPYTQLALAHSAVFAWARERDHPIAGALREIYRNDPSETNPGELRTDVLLPIAVED